LNTAQNAKAITFNRLLLQPCRVYLQMAMLTIEELQLATELELQTLAALCKVPGGLSEGQIITALSDLADPEPGDLPLGSGLNEISFDLATSIRVLLSRVGLPTAVQAAIIRAGTLQRKFPTDPRLRNLQKRLIQLWEITTTLRHALSVLEKR
jgi:hypothetical protein